MTDMLSTEEKAYLKFVQIRDELKEQIANQIMKSAEVTQRQEAAITKFIAHFDDFAQLSAKVEKQIAESIGQSADLTAEIAGKHLTDLVRQEVKVIIDEETSHLKNEIKTLLADLNVGITMATNALNSKKQVLTKAGYMVTATFCLASLMVAFGIHYLFPSTAIYKLNDSMAHTYFVGERILNNWSKLSDKEKDKILSLTIQK